jgi:hypothetical protein
MAERRWSVCLGLVLVLTAWAATPVWAAPLGVPSGFRVEASNGYSIRALAGDGESRGRHDILILYVAREGSAVTYFFQQGVEVTEDAIAADLGSLGSLDLHFVPTGAARTERVSCLSGPIEFDSGFYEGRIDFEGEEEFTEAHRDRVRGEARFSVGLICGSSIDEGFGGQAPGARLMVRRRWSTGSLELEATKNSPTRPSRFEAEIEERQGRDAVIRAVGAEAGPNAFEFNVPAQLATLKPPAPFSGRGHFSRGRFHGSLAADFPGRANVPLNGMRGGLGRWVGNPGHPFRPQSPLTLSRGL